jgi:class 3 adenylate cyclase
MLRDQGRSVGETRELVVSVLMSDIRAYSTIAEHADPSALARQLNVHRAEMNKAILTVGGTVMQFVGDAVMAVFGAPVAMENHAECAVKAAYAMHAAQAEVNRRWEDEGLPVFGLGIGVTTGLVAAALLGSEERLEYTMVGDTVNLAQRLQQWAEPGETVLSEATYGALADPPTAKALPPALVKGRDTLVAAWLLAASGISAPNDLTRSMEEK